MRLDSKPEKAGGGATGLCPGSIDYSMLLQRAVNNFLDDGYVNLAGVFFAGFGEFVARL